MLFYLICLHTPSRGNIHAFNSPGSSDWVVPPEVKSGEKVGSSITVARVVTQKVGLMEFPEPGRMGERQMGGSVRKQTGYLLSHQIKSPLLPSRHFMSGSR